MDGYINVIICQFVQALLTHKQDLNTIRTFKFDKKWDFKKIFLRERFWHDCHLTLLCQEEGGAQCSRHMPLTDVNCNCIMHNYTYHHVHYAHYPQICTIAHCTNLQMHLCIIISSSHTAHVHWYRLQLHTINITLWTLHIKCILCTYYALKVHMHTVNCNLEQFKWYNAKRGTPAHTTDW